MNDPIELTDEEYDAFIGSLREQRCQHPHGQSQCPPPPERAILLDLIAELRDIRDSPGVRARNVSPWYAIDLAAERAEALLRELIGHE